MDPETLAAAVLVMMTGLSGSCLQAFGFGRAPNPSRETGVARGVTMGLTTITPLMQLPASR